ncbi:MAG TPA: SusC/RagA family TonB-linked outer membrane protein [Gemmatimonadaceae bacterium]|nr:SusC/RagA family TonB-linked outer membrane protein [Gemmatimonadaceae bacterium]
MRAGIGKGGALLLAFAVWAGTGGARRAGAQQTATLTGQVVDSAGRQPLADVEIAVLGAGATEGPGTRGARTNPSGHFTVTGLPAGTVTVRARLIGYQPVQREVTLRAGEIATADFALSQQSAMLDQVVVTGTPGETQRRAVGNVIESIKPADVLAVAPALSVGQVIGDRTPGVVMLPASGQVGTGSQVRIRSTSSMSLSNDPIIYIDGVRMDAAANRGPTQRGGLGASRLDDIDPNDIESIEVIKGPAAGTLYGTEASNGVIQIITKRGKTGAPQWNFSTRQGTNWLANPEGRAGMLFSKDPKTGLLDSVNLYRHEVQYGNGPIFTNGNNQGYDLSLAGGTDITRYFTSLSWDDDVGVVDWNWAKKLGARANLDLLVNDKLKIQTSVGYVRNRTRLAQEAIDVDPFGNLVWGSPLTLDKGNRGFESPPEEWPSVQSHADADRTTTSITTSYSPFSWFTNRLVTGLDVTNENNWTLYPLQPEGTLYLGSDGLGNKSVSRALQNYITLDYAGSAKYSRGENLSFTSSVGLQYYHNDLSTITATGSTFPAIPITTVSGGATRSGSETYSANATVGVFGQEEAAWNNRVFLTAALRGDDNSAFGKQFKAAYYPKFSGAWVMSEEPWFHLGWVNSFRLRAALGAAGTQPGTFDASQLYTPAVGYQNKPALVPGSFGNPALKPERSTELETGFESTVLGGRVDINYTHYHRRITDAIVNDPLAPSLGFPGSQVVNIGRVSGWGDELALNTRILQRQNLTWEFGTQLASNGTRIEDMGGIKFITVPGGQAQNRVDFGIGDIFMYKIRAATIDSSGFVTGAVCDGGTGRDGLEMGGPVVPCSSAPRVRWGPSQPTWQAGFNTTLTLWDNLRLYVRADGTGGNYQADTEVRALHNLGLTRAVILRNDPLLQAYRGIENDATGTYKAGFLRLREVSATYTLPQAITARMGVSRSSVSVAGRNLMMLWTAQDGWNTARDGQVSIPVAGMHVWDPEIRASGQLSSGFQTIMPPTASFTATLRLTF